MNRGEGTDRLFSKAQRYCREIDYDTKWVYRVSLDTIALQEFLKEYIWVFYA
jgi:hypothetical protein